MTNSRNLFILLPYLKTSAKVSIRGIEFRSSAALVGLAPDAVTHLQALSRIFLESGMAAIEKMLCAVVPLPDDRNQASKVLRRVSEAQLLIAYIYTGPHPGGGVSLSSEQATLFAVEADRVPGLLVWGLPAGPRGDMIAEYTGTRNFDLHAIFTEQSRIPPEPHWLAQNYIQDLHGDIQAFFGCLRNWAMGGLFDGGEHYGEKSASRAFTALKWYWRSCRQAVSPEEAIVDLSIAFESLFQLPADERLTERFKESILTLLGPIERLGSWIDQFYAARSKTVHEGSPPELCFYVRSKQSCRGSQPEDMDGSLRPLWGYGLRVFRLCLNTLLAGAAAAKEVGLEGSFFHNQERIQMICQRLGESGGIHDRLEAIRSLVEGLDDNAVGAFEYGVELKTMFGVAKRLLMSYKEAGPPLSADGQSILREAVDALEADNEKYFQQLKRVAGQLAKEWPLRDPADRKEWDTVKTFLNYATRDAFRLRIQFSVPPAAGAP